MVKKYNYNSDFDAIGEQFAHLDKASMEDIFEINRTIRRVWEENETDDEIKITKTTISTSDNFKCNIQIIEPKEIEISAPCLLFYHSGGFVFAGMEHHVTLLREYAIKARCKVFYIDYRLLPEFPFPAALNDCYSLLNWVYDNALALGIDRQRIIVGGDSAGGCISAVITQKSRDENGPAILGQLLCYPATDMSMSTHSMQEFTDTPIWNAKLSHMFAPMYCRDGDFGNPQYISPIDAKSLFNLPTAYVETAEFDCLRDEGIHYAKALKDSGVLVLLNETKGTIHCYDAEMNSSITRQNIEKRINFLNELFRNKVSN